MLFDPLFTYLLYLLEKPFEVDSCYAVSFSAFLNVA